MTGVAAMIRCRDRLAPIRIRRCAALLVVALASPGCAAAGRTGLHTRTLAYRSVVDPSSFVYVTNGRTGFQTSVELRSPVSGRLVKVIARFGGAFTNNGLALSPDTRDVYVTLIGHRTLRIVQIDAADRSRRFIAGGELPTVSPDGRQLAFVAGDIDDGREIAVRDLTSGRTRLIDLTRLVGRSVDLFNGSLTWLSNGADIVAIPVPMAVLTSRATESRARVGACGAIGATAMCLVVVHVGSAPRPLGARVIVLHAGLSPSVEIAGEASRPTSLLLGELVRNRAIIDRIGVAGTRPTVARILSLGPVLPIAFDSTGTHLLYLVGHSPPALWVGQIASGRLVNRHRLIANADLGDVAW